MMNEEFVITKEILYNNGFKDDKILSDISLYIITSEDIKIDMILYTDESPGNSEHIWSCHIDNNDRCSIGWVELSTIKQFNLFMEIIGTKYRII